MVTVKDYILKLNKISISSLVEIIIQKHLFEIIDINQIALENGKNHAGFIVGYYSLATEFIATNETPRPIKAKIHGEPYNFEWTGSLFKKMFLIYKKGDAILQIDSKGKGDSDKKIFIEENNLLGFSDNGSNTINYKIILPNLQNKVKSLLR